MSMKRLQRMPGASFERPRACKLTDIEPQSIKGTGGCNSSISSHAGSGGNGSGSASGTIDDSASRLGSIARFPKLDECAHFHYEHVELGNIEVSISCEEHQEEQSNSFAVRVTSGDACWTLQRTYENLVMFDEQLHRCIFDRQFSQLADLQNLELSEEDKLKLPSILKEYMQRFSNLGHEGLNCGPVLNWLQLDNRGRRILVPESDSCPINTPAVAAAYAVRPYQAQAQDELSFQVGDMISVIDMPPAGESSWWRGKHGFAVGFFPAECVAVIGDKLPRHLAATVPPSGGSVRTQTGYTGPPRLQPVKPVLRKHGKLIAFFRSFILNRPSRRRLKQSGILRERVFGCDLGEHLLNSGHEVPSVLSCCAEFIERHGLVDGIYRLSGVTSNIQRLRHAFDEDRVPALHSDEGILHDIHSVASLLKMYFRELPNPLCTYQLYSSFVSAVQSGSDSERLRKMKEAVRKLPPPHYRTLEYLMRHLVRVAARGEETGMTPRNVAIVWAPNLLRCKELEVGGVAALQGVGVQAVVTEFLICYAELIFSSGPNEPYNGSPTGASSPSGSGAPNLNHLQQRPKSLAIASNSARLLSLEEARNRSLAPEPELIEVGAGSAGLPLHYHTIIELPAQLQRQQSGSQRKRNGSKRSPSLNWRALFGGRQSSKGRSQSKQLQAIASPSLPLTAPAPTLDELGSGSSGGGSLRRLRPVKSADSLDGTAEDGLAPLLLGPSGQRTCGHSRSVSHDSYFEQLGGEQPSAANSVPSATSVASALDLSEIQLSFELEEREMRMLEEAGSGRSRQSLEASPRRQRPKELSGGSSFVDTGPESETSSTGGLGPLLGSKPSTGGSGSGGSKRKRSRLEERLQCDVELRFIDSQSPDQVMVSVDVHEMESPSPLPTPGYLPLLSEGSTPLSPAATTTTVSPRISFKSFALPLDLDERVIEKDNRIVKPCLTKTAKEPDNSLRLEFDLERLNQNSAMELSDKPTDIRSSFTGSQQKHLIDDVVFESTRSVDADEEMATYEPLIDLNTPVEAVGPGPSTSQNLSVDSNNDEEKNKIINNTFNESNAISEETQKQVACVLRNNLSDLTNSDFLMPLQQECASNSNFEIGIDRDSKVVTPGLSNYLSDLSTDPVTTFDQVNDNHLQYLSDANVAVEETLSDLNSSDKTCQESMCCSVSNEAFDIEITSQAVESSFYSTSKNDSCTIENKDSHLIDNKQSSLVKLETNLLPSQFNSKIDESNCQSLLRELTNNKSEPTFSNKQHVKKETTKWDSLQSEKQCKINENAKCNDIQNKSICFVEKKSNTAKPVDLNLCKSEVLKRDKRQETSIESPKNGTELHEHVTSRSKIRNSFNEYYTENANSGCNNSSSIKTTSVQENLVAAIPSESAAVEPQEMAYVPEMLSENNSLDSTFITPVRNVNSVNESVLSKNTATILQEMALHRLSGGDKVDPTPTRRKYDNDIARDRRSFDSEIGREILRERKMKQELESARENKSAVDESIVTGHNKPNPGLPPCLRARHARATRAALSRSLDEAKFNKMTNVTDGGDAGSDYLSRINQNKSDISVRQQQHGSTPNVGSSEKSKLIGSADVSQQQHSFEKSTQSLNKNLGLNLDDPRSRERIEKYKEERRTFFRDKYRPESFKAETGDAKPEKEDEEKALLARLKQRASRPSVL